MAADLEGGTIPDRLTAGGAIGMEAADIDWEFAKDEDCGW